MRPDHPIRYARSGRFNIAYQIVGDGPIDLVLSPGWVTHLDLAWDVPDLARFLQRLASFSRLILFDKRGTGLSDHVSPEALPTPQERMEDVRAVMDAAGAERAVLLGTLGGGAMCGMFAVAHPDRTIALILYGTFGKLEPNTGLLSRLADSQEAALDRVEREWGTEAIGVAFWAPNLVADDIQNAAYLRLTRSSVSPAAARALMQLGYQVDWESVLSSIRVPTLVLHRVGDLVVPASQGRRLAEAIPDARYVELPGIDHLMWVGDQDRVIDEVRSFVGELEGGPGPMRKLVTIMFTDVVGSTQLASELGDRRWRQLLAEHQRVVRQHLGRLGGREIDTAGDGFLATFDGPWAAIRSASSILQASGELGIELRAGIHFGEAEIAEGEVRGIAVHIAARVVALAGPGEILVTSTVKDLAAGSGIRFTDRGSFPLKGVPDAWTLFAVDWQNL